MGGDRIRRVIILELQEEDGEVFEDFLSFLQDHPEIERCKQNKDSIISLPGLEIYPRQRRVYRNEQEIPLTKTEYEILLYLFQNSNHVLTPVSYTHLRHQHSHFPSDREQPALPSDKRNL